LIVLVPGYGGRFRAALGGMEVGVVERWRMRVALDTLARYGGGTLVVSGHQGEAQRLANLAPTGVAVIVEPTARNTFENVQRSLPFLREADGIAIASDLFHARRAERYMKRVWPEVGTRLVPARRRWRTGWWMHLSGAMYSVALVLRYRRLHLWRARTDCP